MWWILFIIRKYDKIKQLIKRTILQDFIIYVIAFKSEAINIKKVVWYHLIIIL